MTITLSSMQMLWMKTFYSVGKKLQLFIKRKYHFVLLSFYVFFIVSLNGYSILLSFPSSALCGNARYVPWQSSMHEVWSSISKTHITGFSFF